MHTVQIQAMFRISSPGKWGECQEKSRRQALSSVFSLRQGYTFPWGKGTTALHGQPTLGNIQAFQKFCMYLLFVLETGYENGYKEEKSRANERGGDGGTAVLSPQGAVYVDLALMT